jgi:hypothetical protein
MSASSKKRSDDRAKTLATVYPNSPYAALAQLAGANQMETEDRFLEAAAEYQKVQPSSSSFLIAQFRAGSCYFQQARKLCLEKKESEADQFVKQAETLVKKAKNDLDAALKTTMDLEAQARLQRRPARDPRPALPPGPRKRPAEVMEAPGTPTSYGHRREKPDWPEPADSALEKLSHVLPSPTFTLREEES